jgi:hypothetical protein
MNSKYSSSKCDCEPNSKHFTNLEDEAIVQRILGESLRGIPPSKAHVQDMAGSSAKCASAPTSN